MKLAVTPFNVSSITNLSNNGADIFILGNEKYANRLVKSFSNIELSEANELIKTLSKEIYIEMNLIVHNENLEEINLFLDYVKSLNVNGIIFGDLAIYRLAKRKEMEHLLIYNPETLITNYYDPLFWEKKQIKGVTLAKELTLEDIMAISGTNKIEISFVGHGYLNMFHSRRPLIENFFKYKKEDYDKYIDNRNLHLVEEIREDEYPVFQDVHGTHIFRDKIMESYKEINVLKNALDVFIIDGIFKDNEYLLNTVKNYKQLLAHPNRDEAITISQKLEKDHDSGFLFKKTVYDKF